MTSVYSSTSGADDECDADILIVGAGPAGLMSACLLARYGIDFKIIDKQPIIARKARADSIQSRTLEILESMGLQSKLDKMGNRVCEYAFWNQNDGGNLERTNVGPEVINTTPFPWTLSVDKGDFLDVLVEDLGEHGGKVERNMELLTYQHSKSDDRLVAHVRNHETGVIETWRASFILGCDGNESVVREIADIGLDTYDNLDFWAVADAAVVSNLPDIRRRCTIRSPHGNCILSPKKGSTVRIRTLLSNADLNNAMWDMTHVTRRRSARSSGSVAGSGTHKAASMGVAAALHARLNAAVTPYDLAIEDITWINSYSLRKTLAKRFSDPSHAVFFLGSASHTHSPLTKQNINGGIMDAANLAWKLALVIRGAADYSILASYEDERRPLLAKAIEFDCKVDHVFSLRHHEQAAYMGFHDYQEASGYTSGCGARYPTGVLVRELRPKRRGSSTGKPLLLKKGAVEPLTPGKRLLPWDLVRQLDGHMIGSLEVMPPASRFSLVVFAGETLAGQAFHDLSEFLSHSADSPLNTVLPGSANVAGSRGSNASGSTNRPSMLVDLFLIHTTSRYDMFIHDFPQPFPKNPDRIFEDIGGEYHTALGVNPRCGALCLVRPDGYIAMVTELDDGLGIEDFLRDMLREHPRYGTAVASKGKRESDDIEPDAEIAKMITEDLVI